MTQYIHESGFVSPATIIKLIDTKVVDFKVFEKHGYDAVVCGYGYVKESKLNKSLLSFFSSKNISPFRNLIECKFNETIQCEVNQTLDLSQFKVDEKVSVRSTSKGMGFAGTIKRHGFGRGPMSHGSKNHRLPGSIGAGTDPARVFKGTRMSGQMGNTRVTIKNLDILFIDLNQGLLFLKGSVPGKNNNFVEIYN
jgi:large subunit ribosomal protein L3